MGLLLNEASLPPGGTAGAVLVKVGNADYEASWILPADNKPSPTPMASSVLPEGISPFGPFGLDLITDDGFY